MILREIRKTAIICIFTIILFSASAFGIYRYNKIQTYNKIISTANRHMDLGQYDKAIALYEFSLEYKKDPKIKGKILVAKSLKEAKGVKEKGKGLLDPKEYNNKFKNWKDIIKDKYHNVNKSIKERFQVNEN